MKEKFLDLIKWVLILIIGGYIFYGLYPKYYFAGDGRIRANKITGKVELSSTSSGKRVNRIWFEAEKHFILF